MPRLRIEGYVIVSADGMLANAAHLMPHELNFEQRKALESNLDTLLAEGAPTLSYPADQQLIALQIKAVFRRVTEKDEWGDGFLNLARSQWLEPDATSAPLIIRSQLGYTGSDQSREDMLQNSHFVDAEVDLSAKYGSVQWKRIGEYPVTRRLITR